MANPVTGLDQFLHPPEIDTSGGPAAGGNSQSELAKQQIAEAVAFIRQSAIRQIESAQAIMDGAILAAEQVQDKRLELLEQGPEVTGFDIFMDFALTFILESPLAGKILRSITMTMLVPRVKANIVAKTRALLMLTAKPKNLVLGKPFMIPEAIPERIAASHLATQLKDLRSFEKNLLETGSEQGPYPYLVALTKAAREAQPKDRRVPILEASDTPGVAILDVAQQYLSERRLSIQMEHSMFELWTQTGVMPVEDVYKTLRWESVTVNGNTFSVAQIKDRYKRYFELLIWTLLLYEKPLTGKSITTPRQSFTLKGYVQPSLIAYWLKRFVNPDNEKPFSETPALKRPDGKPDLDKSIPALGNYMWEVAKVAVQNKVALLSSGPLVPRKSLLE